MMKKMVNVYFFGKKYSVPGDLTGRIIAVHTQDFDYKGHRHRATPQNPQYEIQSDKTEHIAAHRGAVLQRIP